MKVLYFFTALTFFLFYGCCGLDGGITLGWKEYTGPKTKHFTIINHTNKTYKDNFLASLAAGYLENDVTKKWKLYYRKASSDNFYFNKITTIEPEKHVNKNKEGDVLQISKARYLLDVEYNRGDDMLFVLSLGDGERKIFFGAYHYHYEEVYKNTGKCEREFVGHDVNPVWQERDLTIHIYKNKITFSDPKIKEAKKICLKALYDYNQRFSDWYKKIGCKEEADPNTLELVNLK